MPRHRFAGVMAFLIVVLALVGATAADGDAATSEKSTDWRMGYDDKFDAKLNLFQAQLSSSYFVFTMVYDLFPYNWSLADTSPDPDSSLVTSHDISPDGLEYTFHLREGVQWNDGEPFDADDVIFSYNAYHDASVSVLAGYVRNMDSIEKVDEFTVKYTLKTPDARVLSAYTPVIPEHIWGDQPIDKMHKFEPCCPIVGTGPYTITTYDPAGTTILTKSEHFWGENKGEVERILMIKYGDKEPQLRDIKENQLDAVLSGDSKWVQNVERDPTLQAWAVPTPGFTSIAFNMCPPGGGDPKNTCTGPAEGVRYQVVQDLAIRQALAWGIDREDLVRTVYSGQAEPGNGLISPFYEGKGYFQSFAGDPEVGYNYNPDKARQILADGGWDCPSGGICQKDGITAQFELLVRSEVQDDQSAAKRVAAWARDIGIQIDVSPITTDSLYERNYPTSPEDPNKYEPDYDAFLWGWAGDLPTPDFNFEVTRCGDYWQDTFYCNPDEYDHLPNEALQELDFDKRVDLMHQAERVVLRDAPYIILVHDAQIMVTRTDTWTGYKPSPETNGYPFSTSWLQMLLLKPGVAAKASYAGAPAVMIGLVAGVLAVFLISRWRRRKEETGPFEVGPLPSEQLHAPVGAGSSRE